MSKIEENNTLKACWLQGDLRLQAGGFATDYGQLTLFESFIRFRFR